jgi:predicted nucleic-acid-binding protein
MIGIDTNVLVRYLAQDNPDQTKIATAFIEDNCTKDNLGFINHITLCEMCWVLKRLYKTPKEQLAGIIEQLLRTTQLCVQEPQVVWMALEEFKADNADFPDCLIAQINLANYCSSTVTFDVRASNAAGFNLLS